MKCQTCSHLTKKHNLSKWYAQSWRLKVNWKKALPLNCTVSSYKNARKTCTSYWPSVQSATTSEQEFVCSHLWSTAAQSTGSKTGHKTPCSGWLVSSSTPSKWSNPFAKNASKWYNTTTPQHLNGQNNSWTSSNVIIMSLQLLTSNLSQHLRNCSTKNESKSNQIFSSTKTDTKRLSLRKNQSKVWRLTWLICSPNLNKQQSILKRRWRKSRLTRQKLMSWKKVSKAKKRSSSRQSMQPIRLRLNVRRISLKLCQHWELLSKHWKSSIRSNSICSRPWRSLPTLSESSWRPFA